MMAKMRSCPELPPDDVAELAQSDCISNADAINRLGAVLSAMGGTMQPSVEPGLPPHRRAIEDVLRSTIRFLAGALSAFVITAHGWNVLFLT